MDILRCIVVDDEPLARVLLKNYVEQTEGLEIAATYASSAEAAAALACGGIDVAFLDIEMPGMKGTSLAQVANDAGTKVVFVTAYKDYAFDGFRLNAVGYLLKPVSYDEFVDAVRKVRQLIAGSRAITSSRDVESTLTVRSNYHLTRVATADLVYIEGLRDYVRLHLRPDGRTVVTQQSMKGIMTQLPADRFIRIHRSYIVDKEAVAEYSRSSVTLVDASTEAVTLPIGAKYRSDFYRKIKP